MLTTTSSPLSVNHAPLTSPHTPLHVPQWYVLRCSSGDVIEVCENIEANGFRAFTPTEYRPTMIGNEKVWQQEPSRPDLLFVYGTYDTIRTLLGKESSLIHFVCAQTDGGTATPITVPEESMSNLIRLVEVGMPQSYSVTDKEIHYRPGGPVRIIDGPFKGVVGRVARIHTQTRVVVTIPGIISFATTYIPKHQMEAV